MLCVPGCVWKGPLALLAAAGLSHSGVGPGLLDPAGSRTGELLALSPSLVARQQCHLRSSLPGKGPELLGVQVPQQGPWHCPALPGCPSSGVPGTPLHGCFKPSRLGGSESGCRGSLQGL